MASAGDSNYQLSASSNILWNHSLGSLNADANRCCNSHGATLTLLLVFCVFFVLVPPSIKLSSTSNSKKMAMRPRKFFSSSFSSYNSGIENMFGIEQLILHTFREVPFVKTSRATGSRTTTIILSFLSWSGETWSHTYDVSYESYWEWHWWQGPYQLYLHHPYHYSVQTWMRSDQYHGRNSYQSSKLTFVQYLGQGRDGVMYHIKRQRVRAAMYQGHQIIWLDMWTSWTMRFKPNRALWWRGMIIFNILLHLGWLFDAMFMYTLIF